MLAYSYPTPGAPGAQAPQSGIAPYGDFRAVTDRQRYDAARTSWRAVSSSAVSSLTGRRVSHFPAASSWGQGGGR